MSARKVVQLSRASREPASAPGAFQMAHDAYLQGNLEAAAAYVEFEASASVADRSRIPLLVATLARIRGDAKRSYDAATIAMQEHPTSDGRLTATALAAAAARRLGDDADADRLFSTVRKAVTKHVGPETAQAAYLLGLDAWTRGDLDVAEREIEPFVSVSDPDAWTLSLSGWISIRRNQFRKAGVAFAAALTKVEEGPDLGAHFTAKLLHATAMTAVETADMRLGRRVRKSYEAFVWTPSLRAIRFQTLLAMRVLSQLDGDLERAWFEAREATALAPSPALRAMAEVNAGSAARFIGDEHATRIQFKRAWALVREQRWSEASEEESYALCDFATEAARELPNEARHAMTMYESLHAKGAFASAPEDGRRGAFAAFARARVDEALGERGKAIEGLRQALDEYEALGQNYRIALVAADLFRLTRDESYRTLIEESLKRAPRAWLLAEPSPADALGPKAREILARLLVGESAKSVAADLGRSTFTVSNHTRRIFEVFGVHSRDALREKCAEMGITPASLRAR